MGRDLRRSDAVFGCGLRSATGAIRGDTVFCAGAERSLTRRCRCPNRATKRWRVIAAESALWLIDTAWELILPAAILLTGFSARMRDWATRRPGAFFIIAIYFAIFSIVTFVIDLPRAYYEEFVREHAYGLSNQTFSKWFGDHS